MSSGHSLDPNHNFNFPLPNSYSGIPSMKFAQSGLNPSFLDADKLSQLSLDVLNRIPEEAIRQINLETLEHLTYKYALAVKMVNNLQRSTALLRLGAIGGCLIAQKEYASRLWRGKGVNRNPLKAFKWYLEAAEAGDEDSINFLKTAEEEDKIIQYFRDNIPLTFRKRIQALASNPPTFE